MTKFNSNIYLTLCFVALGFAGCNTFKSHTPQQNQNQNPPPAISFSTDADHDPNQQVQNVLFLSGGGSPMGNNYSQYLQAIRFTEYLRKLPSVNLRVHFSSGMTPQTKDSMPPNVAYKENYDSDVQLIKGDLPQNHPATLKELTAFFENDYKNKTWKENERAFLIVGDHGLPNPYDPFLYKEFKKGKITKFYDNCIDLWQPEKSNYPETQFLSVSKLKSMIANNIPQNVPFHFIMTQCYSGNFHALAYSYDLSGFPIKDAGDRCGFTAITKDTTASGCTSFVSKEFYDGYERRIAEEITGTSILEGTPIKAPVKSVLEAHNLAMLSDHTKDVPLRTSESFVVDWFEAKELQDSDDWNDKIKADQWSKIANVKTFYKNVGLSQILENDFGRRLDLIEKIAAQLKTWYPLHVYTINTLSLKEMLAQKKTIQDLLDETGKKYDEYDEKVSDQMQDIRKKFTVNLQYKIDEVSKQQQEFLMLKKMDQSIIYDRLLAEDPTLKKYQDYKNFLSKSDQIVLEWANITDDKKIQDSVHEIEDLNAQLITVKNEYSRLQVFYGELRRLITQMEVASEILWLAEKGETAALTAVEEFVACEESAQLPYTGL